MGGEPWMYFVDYEEDVGHALEALKLRELRAGRYNPVQAFLAFPVESTSPAPGGRHSTIEQAREDADADGTRSILDMDVVGQEPDFGVVVPLDSELVKQLYGSVHPTREMIEDSPDFLDEVERGHGVYLIAFEAGRPRWLCFAGYSYD